MSRTALTVKLTRKARADLSEVWLYIADRDRKTADRVLDEIERVCQLIATHPKMGRERPEILPGLRSFGIMSWTIFYRVDADAIEVVRVLHGARDIDEMEF